MTEEPEHRDGMLFLPVRALAERLGASVKRRVVEERMAVETNDFCLEFLLPQQQVRVNGETMDLERPFFLQADTVLAPAGFLCRYFGLHWAEVDDVGGVILSREEPALKGKRVMLDAGDDEGPVTRAGLSTQAQLAGDITQRVEELLRLSGAEVFCTGREGEVLPPITRVQRANELKADMFVSLQCNSFRQPDLNGTETYWYHSWAGQKLATSIQQNLVDELGTLDRGVKEAAFYLLRQAAMAAVVVKVAFITGTDDAPLLADAWKREKAALGIFRGIRQYSEEESREM